MSKLPIFTVSHRLAEKAAETWVERKTRASYLHDPRWKKRDTEDAPWKKRDWQAVQAAWQAGARWMLKPFQQVCGFDRSPPGKQWQSAWRLCRKSIRSRDETLEQALSFAWHSGRRFMEAWVSEQRVPRDD